MSKKLVMIAIAAVASLASPVLAAGTGHHKNLSRAHSARPIDPAAFGNARNAVDDFTGYPTDYLNERFGDRQAQGRL